MITKVSFLKEFKTNINHTFTILNHNFMKYIVLLRGVNVSGKNKILMKEFVKLLLAQNDFSSVVSYIQSGNLIIESNINNTKDIAHKIHEIIKTTYQYTIDVFCYSLHDFNSLINSNPFEIIDKRNYFVFTDGDYQNINKLDQKYFGEDKYSITPKMIYLLYNTKYSDSKLNNNYLESQLKTKATTRNWNTVLKLLTLAQS